MTATRPRRRGHLVHLRVDEPTRDITVDPAVTDVLAIVHRGDLVLGQKWLRPDRVGGVSAEALWRVVVSFSDEIAHADARDAVLAALGAPVAPTPVGEIAVVVCSKDRHTQLRKCLESLLALNRPVELLVVDNGSATQDTKQVCDELSVRCVREDRPGLSWARNRGIAETSAPLIAFTDDDVTAAPDWLDGVEDAFADTETMVTTGYTGPLEIDLHEQVEFEAHGAFDRYPFGRAFTAADYPPMIAAGMSGAGANMVLRRELFDRIGGGFDTDFGAGTPVGSAEETLLFYRALEAGYRIQYCPTQKLWHQHRADRDALLRTMRSYTLGEFTWTAHAMRTRGDLTALRIWLWWARHLAGDIRRNRNGSQNGVELSLTLAELRGVAAALPAARTVQKLRRLGNGGPAPVAGSVSKRSSHTLPLAAVTAEPPASLTVAIPSHQRRGALQLLLGELATQSVDLDRLEVLVALDGCTDGSGEMVRALEVPYRLRALELDKVGVSRARNQLVQECSNPVVVFLDDDIVPEPGCLAAFADAHADASDDVWVFGPCPPELGLSWMEQTVRNYWNDHYSRKAAAGHQWTVADFGIGNSAAPVRALRELGGFDEVFRSRREDYELGYRYLQSGRRCSYRADARATHYATATVETMLRNAFREAEHDVTFCVLHPEVARQLPLGRSGLRELNPTPLERRFAGWTDARVNAIAGRLERLGQREAWKRLIGGFWTARYRAGLRAGLTAHGLDALPAIPPAPQVRVSLDGIGPAAAPFDGVALPVGGLGGADLVFERGGQVLGSLPALHPGEQWCWTDIADRAAEALAPSLALSEAMR